MTYFILLKKRKICIFQSFFAFATMHTKQEEIIVFWNPFSITPWVTL